MLKPYLSMPPTVWRMTIAQGLSMSVMNINIINTGLAGALLAPALWMATLPLSLQFVAVIMATLPASLLMARFGRGPVFIIGVCIALTATLIQGLALIRGDFTLFISGSVLLGFSHGTAQFYRYAAADAVAVADKPKAVSFVLLGGLFAAFVGPEIAYRFVGAVDGAPYAGAFFGAAGVQFFAFFALAGLDIPPPDRRGSAGRPLSAFFATASFRLGLVVAALGYACMSFLMTATPLQIVNISQLGTEENARVIQWHVIAMFAPSFFTGLLVSKFGVRWMIVLGALLYGLVAVFALAGNSFWHYFAALFLLGLGWNFLFVTGTTLIARIAKPVERGRVQGVSDLVIFACVAIASLSAGVLHSAIGWDGLVLSCLLPMGLIMAMLLATPQARLDAEKDLQ
ncbi:MAG: MFS transporter [Alphaproteobacteria bacterium]|nr:MFS transporter [Alphaproteobacteria bacterium]MBL6775959.1 MFS transporter [Alphaproteobacteria bacterium]